MGAARPPEHKCTELQKLQIRSQIRIVTSRHPACLHVQVASSRCACSCQPFFFPCGGLYLARPCIRRPSRVSLERSHFFSGDSGCMQSAWDGRDVPFNSRTVVAHGETCRRLWVKLDFPRRIMTWLRSTTAAAVWTALLSMSSIALRCVYPIRYGQFHYQIGVRTRGFH